MDISKCLLEHKLDTSSNIPLYLQLAEIISDKITGQVFPAGTKLPPERVLARMFSVSRTTAINAYRHLEQQGTVNTRVGSGTYVAGQHSDTGTSATRVPWAQLFTPYPQTPLSSILRELVSPPAADMISLSAGIGDSALYPVGTFTNLLNEHIQHVGRADFGHIPTEGYDPLRQSVAAMLAAKGIPTKKDNVMILAGSQQGLYLLSKILLEPGDCVIIEASSFIGAIQVFQASGARVLSLPPDDRFPLAALEDYLVRYRPKMLYLIPTFHNPTGRTMSLEERRDLLQLAARHRLIIVEDDPYSDLYYDWEPPPSLKALDTYGGVVYLSTFSKILFSGLRIGYISASPILINRLALEKQYIDLHSNNISQWMVHLFLEAGNLDSHLTLLRREYKKRRDHTAKALRRFCGKYLDFSVPDGGFYFWCKIKQSGTSRRLLHEATKTGVSFVPGEAFYTTATPDKEFRLCFTTRNQTVLHEGIRRLAKAIAQTANNKGNEDSLLFTPVSPII